MLPGIDEQAIRVFHWRTRHLLGAGFTLRQARRLASRTDVVHEAETLLAQGCPVNVVFDLLS